MNRIEMIKKAAEKSEIKNAIKNLNARKAEIKSKLKEHSKLTQSVKKAEHQAPKSLEAFSHENMYYSDKEIHRYLEGSQIMESYSAMKNDWD